MEAAQNDRPGAGFKGAVGDCPSPLRSSQPRSALSMATLTEAFTDLSTSRGAMRVHTFTPTGGGKFPAVIFFSEIFQVTGPIRRMAAALAGEGYLVAVPEVYHEFEELGSVLAYDQAGSDRGNALK